MQHKLTTSDEIKAEIHRLKASLRCQPTAQKRLPSWRRDELRLCRQRLHDLMIHLTNVESKERKSK